MNESQHNPYVIPLSILVSGVLIAGAITYVGDTKFGGAAGSLGTPVGGSDPTTAGTANVLEAVLPPSSNDHMLGNPSAPVKIIEYSDLECPFCSRFHLSMKQAMEEYGKDGKIAWIYRHFPLEQIHEHARPGAMASECAAELGGSQAFWSFVDMVFSRQEEGLGQSLFVDVAKNIGLDSNAFSSCIASAKYDSIIDASIENAIASGGQGTPYSVMIATDGSKQAVNGAVPYQTLKAQIEQALAK